MVITLGLAACTAEADSSIFNPSPTITATLPPIGEVGTSAPESDSGDEGSSGTQATTGNTSDTGESTSTTGSDTGVTGSDTDTAGACTVPGLYANCAELGTGVCGNGSSTCFQDNAVAPTYGVCAVSGCTDVCDCPNAPPTGTAEVACKTVGGVPDLCVLDCTNGTCPTGMECAQGLDVCVFSVACDRPAGVYGDCENMNFAQCQSNPSFCITSGAAAVCSVFDCVDDCDCMAAPGGGTAPVVCSATTLPGQSACILDCSAGQTCPPGMACINNQLCMFP